jgi:DNA polymerase-4
LKELEDLSLRKIIHVDMDAFYASVEQLDNPELKGKPVAVGGSENRGVVSAASYEARVFGIHSAMSGIQAARRCKDLIFVKPRFERYKEVSLQIRSVFYKYSDKVELLSLDEAFLDVTQNHLNCPSASLIAHLIRKDILELTGLTASAGISINKFTAKIASDVNKPNGQKTVGPEDVLSFLEELPIKKFFGVGKVTAAKMNQLGIVTGKQLKGHTLDFLNRNFGKSGQHYYNIVRGIQYSEVKTDRVRKSIGAERTFNEDSNQNEFLLEKLTQIAEELERRLLKSKTKGKTLTLKIKYSDFTVQTRSKTGADWLQNKEEILNVVQSLLEQEPLKNSVRLLGIQMNKLDLEEVDKIEYVQMKLEF